MINKEDVLKSIVPKSDQLNADDLLAGPVTVRVTDVRKGDAEQPIVIVLDGDRQPYKPCKSMRRLIVSIWGDRPKDWIGKKLKLFCDPNVKWAGVKVGGIRIAAMSGITERRSIMLTVARGKRTECFVDPLPDQPEEVKQAIAAKQDYVAKVSKGTISTWDQFASWVSVAVDRPEIKTGADLGMLTAADVEKIDLAAKGLED